MPNRHGQDDDYRYGYQGSEKDDEVHGQNGSSYTTHFRQLDVRIGRWLSIDPKMTAHESPYVSMGNNPASLNDVLGDTARIQGDDGTQVDFRNGSVFNLDGTEYDGNDDYICEAQKALNKLSDEPGGKALVDAIVNSDKTDIIVRVGKSVRVNGHVYTVGPKNSFKSLSRGVDDSPEGFVSEENRRTVFGWKSVLGFSLGYTKKGTGLGSGGIIGWDPASTTKNEDMTGNTRSPDHSYIGLGHELAHGLDAIGGTMRRSYIPHLGGTNNVEIYANHIENIIRVEHGIPLRTYFNKRNTKRLLNEDGSSKYVNDANGNPYNYFDNTYNR